MSETEADTFRLTDEEARVAQELDEQLEKVEPCRWTRGHDGAPPPADYKLVIAGLWCTHLRNPDYLCMDHAVDMKTLERNVRDAQWRCLKCLCTWPKSSSELTWTRIS